MAFPGNVIEVAAELGLISSDLNSLPECLPGPTATLLDLRLLLLFLLLWLSPLPVFLGLGLPLMSV